MQKVPVGVGVSAGADGDGHVEDDLAAVVRGEAVTREGFPRPSEVEASGLLVGRDRQIDAIAAGAARATASAGSVDARGLPGRSGTNNSAGPGRCRLVTWP